MGKDWKSCQLGKISHSEPLWWEESGKVGNQAKLAIPSHSEPLQWKKIGKVANWETLAILSHPEPLWWEEPKWNLDLKTNFFISGVGGGGGVHGLTILGRLD